MGSVSSCESETVSSQCGPPEGAQRALGHTFGVGKLRLGRLRGEWVWAAATLTMLRAEGCWGCLEGWLANRYHGPCRLHTVPPLSKSC